MYDYMDEAALIEWCRVAGENGIAQHSQEWLDAKKYTIGGSSMATIMELNRFSTVKSYIQTKLGITPFITDIRPQWGNMFEEVIKREVEHKFKTTVHGEDLYVVGKYKGTAYSPDGLAIIDGEVVLLEFKCPYSRKLGKSPPAYYIPQVKTGLELLDPPKYGVYIEAVYRRCSWDDLGPAPGVDRTLVDNPVANLVPISHGFIGFYTVDNVELPEYLEEYEEIGVSNDLGTSSVGLFTKLMALMDAGVIRPWYSELYRGASKDQINADLAKYHEFTSDKTNFGILPWKLLQLHDHRIDYTPDYLTEYLPRIESIVDFVKEVDGLSAAEQSKKLDKFMISYYGGGGETEEYDDDEPAEDEPAPDEPDVVSAVDAVIQMHSR